MNQLILSRIESLLTTEMGLEGPFDVDSRLTEDLGFDLIGKVEFLYELETEFQIGISERAGDSINTLRDAVLVVEERVDGEVIS